MTTKPSLIGINYIEVIKPCFTGINDKEIMIQAGGCIILILVLFSYLGAGQRQILNYELDHREEEIPERKIVIAASIDKVTDIINTKPRSSIKLYQPWDPNSTEIRAIWPGGMIKGVKGNYGIPTCNRTGILIGTIWEDGTISGARIPRSLFWDKTVECFALKHPDPTVKFVDINGYPIHYNWNKTKMYVPYDTRD